MRFYEFEGDRPLKRPRVRWSLQATFAFCGVCLTSTSCGSRHRRPRGGPHGWLSSTALTMLGKLHPFIKPTHEPLDWFNRHIA